MWPLNIFWRASSTKSENTLHAIEFFRCLYLNQLVTSALKLHWNNKFWLKQCGRCMVSTWALAYLQKFHMFLPFYDFWLFNCSIHLLVSVFLCPFCLLQGEGVDRVAAGLHLSSSGLGDRQSRTKRQGDGWLAGRQWQDGGCCLSDRDHSLVHLSRWQRKWNRYKFSFMYAFLYTEDLNAAESNDSYNWMLGDSLTYNWKFTKKPIHQFSATCLGPGMDGIWITRPLSILTDKWSLLEVLSLCGHFMLLCCGFASLLSFFHQASSRTGLEPVPNF